MGNWNCQIQSFLTKKKYFTSLISQATVFPSHTCECSICVCLSAWGVFYLLVKWGTPLALQWPAVKRNDISCWWTSPRGLFWPCSCDICPIRFASCQNSLFSAQEWNFKYRLHCRNPITNSLTVKIDRQNKGNNLLRMQPLILQE